MLRSGLLGSGLVAVSLAAMTVAGMPTAYADPTPGSDQRVAQAKDKVAEAKDKVETLSMEAAALDQDAIGAQEQLAQATKRLSTRDGDVKAQSAKVDQLRSQISRVALAEFQNRSLSPSAQLVLRSDSQDFLSQYATIQQVSANQNQVLQNFQTQQANLADLKRGAASDVDTINTSTQRIKAARADSAKKVAEAQAVLDKLSAEERAAVEAARAQEARESQQQAEAAQAAGPAAPAPTRSSATPSKSPTPSSSSRSGSGSSSSASSAAAVNVPPGSSRGAAALAFAKAQEGKPYIYGGTGPSGYDCSGLTGAAWASVGVSLPRTSQAQYSAGQSIPISALQPGDLVFYYGGISHVAIYAGGGQIVHASRPGKPIGYAPLNSMPVAGARRVG